MLQALLKSVFLLLSVFAFIRIVAAKEAANTEAAPLQEYPQCEVNLASYSDAVGGPITILVQGQVIELGNEEQYTVEVPYREQQELSYTENGKVKTKIVEVTKTRTETRVRNTGPIGRHRYEVPAGHYRILNRLGKPVTLPKNRESVVIAIRTHDVKNASPASWPRLLGKESLLEGRARIVLYDSAAMRQVPESRRETNPQAKVDLANRFPWTDITLVKRSQSSGDLEMLMYSSKYEEIERTKNRTETYTVKVDGKDEERSREVEYTETVPVEKPSRISMRIPKESCVVLQHDSKRAKNNPAAPLSDKESFAVLAIATDTEKVDEPDWGIFKHGTSIVFFDPSALVPVDQPNTQNLATDRSSLPHANAEEASPSEVRSSFKASDGTSIPQEAQRALAPLLAELDIAAPPIPVLDATLKTDLPGFTFYLIGDPAANGFEKYELVVLSPQKSPRSTRGEVRAQIAKLLRDIFTVQNETDARRYVRTHLTLTKARNRQLKFGKISPINVTANPGGGLRATANMRVVSSRNPNDRRTGFEIDARFDQAGKLQVRRSTYRFTLK